MLEKKVVYTTIVRNCWPVIAALSGKVPRMTVATELMAVTKPTTICLINITCERTPCKRGSSLYIKKYT